MMKKLLFLLLMALFMPWAAQAQITVTIGTGTNSTYSIPFHSLRSYSFVEQLYSASEIQQGGGVAGSITSISFYRVINASLDGKPDASPGQDWTNNIVLYMKNTNETAFNETTDYVPVSADDIVFNGAFSIPAATEGWVTITLNKPFSYDGTSNLLVAIDENMGGIQRRYFAYTHTNNSVHQWASSANGTYINSNPDP